MWLPRTKSTVRVRSSPSSNFSCSSFKDIQHLLEDDSNPPPLQPSNLTKPSIFHRVRLAQSILRAWAPRPALPQSRPYPPETVGNPPREPKASSPDATSEPPISLPGSEKRIVVYYTSLRVVRSTFEDCRDVRSILQGFRVSIDERDLAMDSMFMDELQGILKGKVISLPRVFIGGRYVGGADEIRQLHEAGSSTRPAGSRNTWRGCRRRSPASARPAADTDLSSATIAAEATRFTPIRAGSGLARLATRTV